MKDKERYFLVRTLYRPVPLQVYAPEFRFVQNWSLRVCVQEEFCNEFIEGRLLR
jgi:hypothetical protein